MFVQRTTVLVLLAGSIAPASAQSDDRPIMIPSRDVTVTYHTISQPAMTMHMTTQGSTGLTRVEGTVPQLYVIGDLKTRRVTVVIPDKRAYFEVQPGVSQRGSPVFDPTSDLDPPATVARQGADTVAGVACAVWGFTLDGDSGTVCVTDDGVLLRSRDTSGERGLDAVEVTYGPQPDTGFRPPAEFARVATPEVFTRPPPAREQRQGSR